MEALPISGTYIIRDLYTPNSGLYDIQWCPPYEGDDNDLELFLEAHSELSDDTGWGADIQEHYPDHIPGSTFGEPEKIPVECWVLKNGINDLNHLCGQWFSHQVRRLFLGIIALEETCSRRRLLLTSRISPSRSVGGRKEKVPRG